MRRVVWIVAILAAATLPLGAATTWTVNVQNFTFSPTPVTIGLNDTVRWEWVNGFHSTTSDPGQLESWDSGQESTVGFTYDHPFTHVGSFKYYCTLHGAAGGVGMSGVVNVVPEPSALLALLPAVGLIGRLMIRRR